MKLRITLVLMFVLGSFCFAQTSGFSSAEFNSSMFLNETLTEFEFKKIEKPFAFDFQRDDSNFTMLEVDNDFKINSEALNTNLFSNLNLFKNNYQNDFNYLRGCGPLEGGLIHTVNSSDVMISRFIDYVVNEHLFKNLIFKN